ncbi:MAG: SulP family inorganic anion transporter [Myxococcota bacterium]
MSPPASAAPKAVPAKGRGRRWVADLIAGVSVALVLIPQSMAYAELAGMPAHHGLYASALPPLLAAFFASSPYLQTGPVALTSLLTVGALGGLATLGSPEYVALAALLAVVVGVVRVALGVLRAGTISYLMSQPVLRGFTAAAALLILFSQLPSALGVEAEGASILVRAFRALSAPGTWEAEALGLSAMTLAFMIGGRRLHPLFPGVLLAVVAGVAFSVGTGYEGRVLGEVPKALVPPLRVDLPWTRVPELLVGGVIIALVGFADAVSISQAFAERARKPWDPNKEFVSQGVANLAAGLTGGLPVGGSFSRSAVNALAGAQTRASGAITGLAMLAFLPVSHVLAPLPKAILGAIVVGAVLKLLDPQPMLSLWRQSKLQACVAYATFALTLGLAPRIDLAVLGGVALAIAVHVWRELSVDVRVRRDGETLRLIPEGVIWYASANQFRQALAAAVAEHQDAEEVVLDLRSVGRIDLTGALALKELADGLREDFRWRVEGQPEHAVRILERVCPTLLEAPADGPMRASAGPAKPRA